MLAEAALVGGDFETARTEAEAAATAFARQRRSPWTALARYAALRAAFLEHGPSAERQKAARRAATALGSAGWTVAALDAHLLAARIALALGETAAARRALEHVRVGPREPVDLRVRAKYASALLALADGKRPRAYAALRAGVRLLDDYRVALGATELRAQVGEQLEELAALGLRLALEDAEPARVLAWLEECRAGSLGLRPVRPPDNEELAAELAELRRIVADVQEGAIAGRDVRDLRRRQAALEDSVRQRTRRAPGGIRAAAEARAPAEMEALLGERALIAYLEVEGRLHAVTVSQRSDAAPRARGRAEARAELDALRFALRRLARSNTAPATQAAASEAASHAAARLDELLVRPLAAAIDERPLVLVPTGVLHAMPWSIVPSLAGRPLVVAPSAAAWAEAEARAGRVRRKRVTVAAGPGLPFAALEARRGRRAARGDAAPRRGSDGAGGAGRSGRRRRRASRGARIVPCRQPALLVDQPRRRPADGLRPRVARRGARALRPLGVRLRPLGGEGGRRADGAHRDAPRPRQRHDRRERRHRSRRGRHAADDRVPSRARRRESLPPKRSCGRRATSATASRPLRHAQDSYASGRGERGHASPLRAARHLRGGLRRDGTRRARSTPPERATRRRGTRSSSASAGLVWATVRAHRLNAVDGAEVVQTTWLRLVEHLDRIRDPERLGGWLAATARNECLRQIRLGAREVPSEHGRPSRAATTAPRSQPPDRRARPGVLEGVHRAGRALPDAPPRADGGDRAELPGGLGGPRDADRSDRADPPALPRAARAGPAAGGLQLGEVR